MENGRSKNSNFFGKPRVQTSISYFGTRQSHIPRLVSNAKSRTKNERIPTNVKKEKKTYQYGNTRCFQAICRLLQTIKP